MPITKLGQRRQVVIPKKFCEELGLHEGDFVEVALEGGRLVIKPKRLVDPEDTLTADEEAVVECGFKQLKQGDYVTWDRLKHELGL